MAEQLAPVWLSDGQLSSEYIAPLPYAEAEEIFRVFLDDTREFTEWTDEEIAFNIVDNREFEVISPAIHEPLAVFISRFGYDPDLPVNLNGPLLNLSYQREFMDKLLDNGGERFVAMFITRFIAAGVQLTSEDTQRLLDNAEANPNPEIKDDVYASVISDLEHFDGVVQDEETFLRFVKAGSSAALSLLTKHSRGQVFQGISPSQDLTLQIARSGSKHVLTYADHLGQELDQELAIACMEGGIGEYVLANLENFKGIGSDIVIDLLQKAPNKAFIPSAETLRSIGGLECNSKLADLLLQTKAGTDWLLDDAALNAFDGLNVDHVRQIAANDHETNMDAVFDSPEVFEGLKIDNKFAHMLAVTPNGLRNLSRNLHAFFGLDKTLLSKLMENSPVSNKSVAGVAKLGKTALRDQWKPAVEEHLRNHLFRFEGINQDMINNLFEYESNVEAFPGGGSAETGWSRQQHEWFGRNRYTEALFDSEWSNERLGRVIGMQLRLGLVSTMHDASQWLDTFEIPETVEDLDYILAHRLDADFDPELLPKLQLYDSELERMILQNIVAMSADMRQRLLLGRKPAIEKLLFKSKDAQLAYRALVDDFQGLPLYQRPELTADMLRTIVQTRLQNGMYSVEALHSALTSKEIDEGLQWILEKEDHQTLVDVLYVGDLQRNGNRIIGDAIKALRRMGLNRQKYADSVMSWLQSHAASNQQQLTQAWGGRAFVLAHSVQITEDGHRTAGAEDTISSILSWQTEKAFKEYVQKDVLRVVNMSKNNLGQHSEELAIANRLLAPEMVEFRAELLRVLSLPNTARALVAYEEWKTTRNCVDQILPAISIPIELNGKTYQFEVLSKEDPRGFTIGEDTGCCQKIDGEAASCVEAGYSYSNAGFMALYAPTGDLAAQSFWYIHPDQPDTLVLDNIEANQGRDLKKVLHVYSAALTQILVKYHTIPVAIAKVHLGEGHTDTDFSHLPVTIPVPALDKWVYTDAKRQRLLIQLPLTNTA